MEILPTIIGIILIIFVVGMFVRSHLIYRKCSGSKEVRNSEPFYYDSPKQGTTKAADCGKIQKKP